MTTEKLLKTSDKNPTQRQSAFAQNLAQGMTKKEAALRAGYSPSTAENTKEIEKSLGFQQSQKSILQAMRRKGISNEKIAQRLHDMLMTPHKVLLGGKIVKIDDIHPTAVAKALNIIFKLRGDYSPLKITSTTNPLRRVSITELLKNLRQLEE